MIGILEKGKSLNGFANTYLGGVAFMFPDLGTLASHLGLQSRDITYFKKVGEDIEAKINKDYNLPASAFQGNTSITYFIDQDKRIKSTGINCFANAVNLSRIDLQGLVTINGGSFPDTSVEEFYFPECTTISGFSVFEGIRVPVRAVYIPVCTVLGNNVGETDIFQNTSINGVYCHPSLATVNAGNPDGDLVVAASNGATISYVNDFTAPEIISYPSVVSKFPTALEILYTEPFSFNGFAGVEVYADGIFSGFFPAGDKAFALNLNTTTTYEITLVSVDEFYNKSSHSNAVKGSTENYFVYEGTFPDHIFSFRRIAPFRKQAIRILRSSDNSETDVLLSDSGFISLSSLVTSGERLEDWIGSADGIVKRIYNALRPDKDLLFTNANYKLISSGTLNVLNGKPAILGNTTTGKGLEALKLNGGQALSDASIFTVFRNNDTSSTNRVIGFGNYSVDGNGTGRKHWNPASDNSFRFDGGAINTPLVSAAIGNKLRSSFKNENTYSDYINGVNNIVPTVLSGTNIVDDLYVGIHITQNFLFSEAIIFLTDESANRQLVENEINSSYGIY